jgi:nicotinate phosphoribosyltransferase
MRWDVASPALANPLMGSRLHREMKHSPPHGFSALTTDLYEVTMACGYWRAGVGDDDAAFHVVFRENPFGGEFTVAAGLQTVVDFIGDFQFRDAEIAYLATQHGNDGKPLFDNGFLDYLRGLRLSCDIDAMPEGTVVFPHEPLIRVSGPIVQCQLLETALLTILNFQSLITTKAARVCHAAENDDVIEFGLRRAQGVDGGLSAARAAYIGGCAGTSNLQAGQRFGIPVSGTQAHSWIMFFETEAEAFRTYAKVMPNNGVFLVDTYDSIEGTRRAIEAARQLRRQGHEMIGVRLDSGDRVALSIEARKLLDAAGFTNARIVCSGDLDEFAIAEMKRRGARIDIWGVGTKLTTGQPDAALGGIYKLGAMRRPGEKWQYRIKLSDEPAKTSCPGLLQVRRYRDAKGQLVADAIYEINHGIREPCTIFEIGTDARSEIPDGSSYSDLLVPIFRQGKLVYQPPSLEKSRARTREQLHSLPPEVLRLENPRRYHVGLETSLHQLRLELIQQARERPR